MKLLRNQDAMTQLGIGRTKLFLLEREGTIPRSIKRGRSKFWLASEMDTIVAAIARGATDEQLHQISRDLEQARQGGADHV